MTALLLSASVTPLKDGGAALDEDAIGPLVEFLQAGGADGVFCCGTTGEGVQLTPKDPDFIDYYNRPWARNWEKWFEAGWEKRGTT